MSSNSNDPGMPSIAFMVINSALIFLMTPGLGLFYAGLSRSKNALSSMSTVYIIYSIVVCMVAYSIVTLQWSLFGFSLNFGDSDSSFIGNLDHGGFSLIGGNSLENVSPQVPSTAFGLYNLQFAAITAAIIFGSVSERFRLLPAMIFIFLWTTFVYDFVAYWTWGARGWLRNMACVGSTCGIGSYDYAGGGPVHVASGFAGLAYCIVLGKRKIQGKPRPHNMMIVFLGTALLWFGWFGFNGGSAIAATPRAAMAAYVTVLSPAACSLTWMIMEYIYSKRWSAEAYCSGVVTGLVAITPSSGFVAPWAAIVIGIVSGIFVYYAVHLKYYLKVDDTLDAFGAHGLGGVIGNILTGFFAQKWVAELDGSSIDGGWIEGHFVQLGYQIAGTIAIAAYSFVVSFIILWLLNKIPGLELRSSDHHEHIGVDLGEMGEMAYESTTETIELIAKKQESKIVAIPSNSSHCTIDAPLEDNLEEI